MTPTRILVVEDEAVTSLAIIDTLEELGYESLGPCVTGEDAIQHATTDKPDLILMDIQLKGSIDGISAATEIWNALSIPIVFLTAYSDEETLARAKLSNPFGFILKPFRDRELHATIQLALSKAQNSVPKAPQQPAPNRNVEVIDFGSGQLSPLAFLKRVDPIRKLPENVLGAMANAASFEVYKNNTFITHEGSEQTTTWIVAEGRVALLKSTSAGKELTVGLLPPGDVFGLAMSLDDAPSPYSILSHGETTVLAIPISLLRTAFEAAPELYKEFYEDLTDRMQQSHTFSLRLAHDRVEVRVAAALLELLSRFCRVSSKQPAQIVQVTRQQLAQIAGTTPETTIRITRAMENAGILALDQPGQITIIDADRLEQLVDDSNALEELT